MNVSYDLYRIFCCVAECGSISRAAQRLMSSQPNVTRSVKQLEAALGCTLFVRSRQGVALTPEGELLLAHASAAVRHIQAAERELAQAREMQGGAVAIGATEVALRCLLLPVLKGFKQRWPGVQIRVCNHSTPQAVSALESGLVDLAVVTTPVDVPESCMVTPIRTVREVPVCSGAYAQLLDGPVSLAELSACPIVCLGRQTKTYELYSRWFMQHGLNLSPSIEASTADQILPLVRSDLGVGFVPEDFLRDDAEGSGVHRIALREAPPERSVCLLQPKGKPLSIAATALVEAVRKAGQ